MGIGASNPGKHTGSSRRHHHGTSRNYQRNGWTQHYHNHSRTISASSPSTRQTNPAPTQWVHPEEQPAPSVTRSRRSPGGVVIRQTPQSESTQPIMVTTTTRIHTPNSRSAGVQQSRPAGQQQGRKSGKPKIDYSTVECGVCGHTGHGTRFCHHRNQTCHICNEQGHIASVCKQKVHHEASRYKPRQVK